MNDGTTGLAMAMVMIIGLAGSFIALMLFDSFTPMCIGIVIMSLVLVALAIPSE